ncbi:hypothetical protein AVEN_35755-1 [Araneus ventricosus]|uniref:Uncharacterized protein n=1 Tax=Araneus ventricosus TaxID=182803 RepID=A0A4Y2FNH1_ARAVE|nr:hypothetical protein AVEN_35755-1 [Araneus ventricosus]
MRTEIQEGKKRFSPEEYISKVQIPSLFARFARKKKKGLSAMSNTEVQQENANFDEEETEVDVHKVMRSIFNNKSDYSVTDWVATSFDKMQYPREITDIENSNMKVTCMKRHGKNTFTLSEEDRYWYKDEEILCKISVPAPLNARFFFFFSLSGLDKTVTKLHEEMNK